MVVNILKKLILIFICALFVSCNWNILSGSNPDIEPGGSSNIAYSVFTGDAPRNIQATKSSYTDKVIVSFDSVKGADYYRIYRTSVPRSETVTDYDALTWKRIEYDLIPETPSGRIYWTDSSIDQSAKNSTKYLYRVLAQSYLFPEANAEAIYSDVAEGWTLSPPAAITATGGTSETTIYLSWDAVDSIKGYNIYYSTNELNPDNNWVKANSRLIPAPPHVEMQETFIPPDSLKGDDIYFKVVSVSNSNTESERSNTAHGWTLVPGAPSAPTQIVPSRADSPNEITIRWAKSPNEDPDKNPYTWEVRRNAPGEDQVLIASYYSGKKENTSTPQTRANNAAITLDGDTYILTDTSSDLKPNVEYTYRIRAISKVQDETTGELVDAIGAEATTVAFLMSPPTVFTNLSATYPSGPDKGSFSFTIEAPIGFEEDDNWSYIIWGRNIVRGKVETDWTEGIIDDIPVTEDPVSVSINYETAKGRFNEFSVSVIDNDTQEKTKRYGEDDGAVISAGLPETPALTILTNKVSGGTASSEGIYPLYYSVTGSQYIESLELEIVKANTPTGAIPEYHDIEASSSAVAFSSSYYPSKIGEAWMYRVRGVDPFGRYTDWTGYQQGYGALTGKAFIKMFEMYGLKPWEYINGTKLSATLKSKWSTSNNDISRIAIDGPKIPGDLNKTYTVSASGQSGGSMSLRAEMGNGLSGTVTFNYTNFGEVSYLSLSGTYNMPNVGLDGSNGGQKCQGSVTVTGMYPATVDFTDFTIVNKAFSGQYILTQENGSGVDRVTPPTTAEKQE